MSMVAHSHLFGQSELAEFLLDISTGFVIFAFLEGLLDGRIFVNSFVSVDDFTVSGRLNNGVGRRFHIGRTLLVQFVSGRKFAIFIF